MVPPEEVASVIPVKCPYPDCEHPWDTTTRHKYVTCPSCYRKINVEKCRTDRKPADSPPPAETSSPQGEE